MKRQMTFIAFIMATVFLGIDTILELLSIPALIQVINAYGSQMIGVIAITIILIAFIILSLIFNAICISVWNKSVGEYASKKGFIITTVVFNFIVVLLMIISMAIGAVTVMAVLLALILTASNVLILIDMSVEKTKVQPEITETIE